MNRCRRAPSRPSAGYPRAHQQRQVGADVPRRERRPGLRRGHRARTRRAQGLRARPAADDARRGRGRDRPRPADGPPDPAHAGSRSATCARTTGGFALTPRVLELGMTYVQSLGLWDVARPHMEALVARTGESSSIAQLDGSDIVYVARVAVPKIITLRGADRYPLPSCCDVAGQGAARRRSPCRARRGARRAEPVRACSRAGSRTAPSWTPCCARSGPGAGRSPTSSSRPGIRSVAAPLRDGAGRVIAAMNVTVHAAETSVETLTGTTCRCCCRRPATISADFARYQAVPVAQTAG